LLKRGRDLRHPYLPIPPRYSPQVSYFLVLPLLYSLNLFWFVKIVQGVAKALAGGSPKPDKKMA
jgi:hypothetical protein